MRWAALFSQTGSEICNLSERLGTYPNLVISDNVNCSIDERININCKEILWRSYKKLSKEEKILYYIKTTNRLTRNTNLMRIYDLQRFKHCNHSGTWIYVNFIFAITVM